MTFAEAPSAVRGLVDLTFFIQFILLVTVLFVNLKQKRVFPVVVRNIIMILMAIAVFLLYQMGVGYETENGPVFSEYVKWYTSLPFWFIFALSTILSLELVVYVAYGASWAGKHITAASVKEAVDNLPGGICIYESSGRIVVKNTVIADVARRMEGGALLDGNAFYEGVIKKASKVGDKYLMFFEDNSVWSFTFDKITDEKKQYSFIMCSDISEEYKKTLELQDVQKEVMKLNVQLTDYNKEIVSTISEKEVLDAKIKIHDELGTGLLAIKHYLTVGGSEEDKAEIVDRINRNIIYLKSETEKNLSDEYELMISTAKTLGVAVEVNGELPEKEPFKHVVATAIHECFTNTLRHAKGNILWISVTKKDGRIEVVFSNNGEPPKDEINEKGGLQSLHSLVDGCGGKMEIISMPDFLLRISLPDKEE